MNKNKYMKNDKHCWEASTLCFLLQSHYSIDISDSTFPRQTMWLNWQVSVRNTDFSPLCSWKWQWDDHKKHKLSLFSFKQQRANCILSLQSNKSRKLHLEGNGWSVHWVCSFGKILLPEQSWFVYFSNKLLSKYSSTKVSSYTS